MCSILHLMPKQMIEKEALMNACYNNWHSYGLVTKVDGKLDIKKVLPKSGEIDPEEVYALLQDDFEYERFLHVRHNTAGATSEENVHPFDVYFDPKSGEQIVFMHNGTLYEYKSKKHNGTSFVDDDDGPSDTKNFTDEILIPLVQANFSGKKADLDNPFFRRTLLKYWPGTGSNRGVLISSKQKPMFIGDWKEFGSDGNKIKVSNTDYFDKVTRGPEFERRRLREEEERKRIEEARRAQRTAVITLADSSTSNASATTIRKFNGIEVEKQDDLFGLSETLANIFNDWDAWDREGLAALGYATKDELEQLYSSKKDCIIAMDLVFTEFAKMVAELHDKNEKISRQEKHIEKMSKELKDKKAA